MENDRILNEAATRLGLAYDFTEYIEDLDRFENFDCNPFSERSREQWVTIPKDELYTFCRIIGIHFNIDTTKEETLRIFQSDESIIDDLSKLGDHSNLRRINAWKKINAWKTTNRQSYLPIVKCYEDILRYNESFKGDGDITKAHKNVYDLVRHKPFLGKEDGGVTEFRTMGATDNIGEVIHSSRVIKKSYGLSNIYGRRIA